MKLLADVNLSGRVVERLAEHGWAIGRVRDHADPRSPDEEVLALAKRLDAVLVTRDQDFGAMLAASRATQPSVVNVRCKVVEPEPLARQIDAALRAAGAELIAGAIVTVDDAGARVHLLPIE